MASIDWAKTTYKTVRESLMFWNLVRLILETLRYIYMYIYIYCKGFLQATTRLTTRYNAFEGRYTTKSNNKIRMLDLHSIDVRRPLIDVQTTNNVRRSNGCQPWPVYHCYYHTGVVVVTCINIIVKMCNFSSLWGRRYQFKNNFINWLHEKQNDITTAQDDRDRGHCYTSYHHQKKSVGTIVKLPIFISCFTWETSFI